ncbi:NAD(+) synthase [candidate division WOR-3 bacterium 4484_100]|uniref:NH(3)-dependent NAD(+) synthetase n=1 Tax=candidate division WOR-3 bacterium 4484_100 TaxID=1936077 RepID=A0A1V4QHA2_UNCW3|nr:MAG: NAD(+) synthase [candidate division WOR-3 bacterium 4484_100]
MVLKLIEQFKKELNVLNKSGVVLGVSGGIDSAVTLKLLERCLEPSQILPVIMPEQDSNKENIKRAKQICARYPYRIISITPILRKLGVYRSMKNYPFIPYSFKKRYCRNRLQQLGNQVYLHYVKGDLPNEFISYIHIKNRIRATILFYEAEKRNFAVVGTINRTEYLLGFFVPFGDGLADIMPLLNLYKTDIFKLARELDVPGDIIKSPPSPDLIPGLNDEMLLGMKYAEVDQILKDIEAQRLDLKNKKFKYIYEIHKQAEKTRLRIKPDRFGD